MAKIRPLTTVLISKTTWVLSCNKSSSNILWYISGENPEMYTLWRGRSSVSNLSLESNLPMFWLSALMISGAPRQNISEFFFLVQVGNRWLSSLGTNWEVTEIHESFLISEDKQEQFRTIPMMTKKTHAPRGSLVSLSCRSSTPLTPRNPFTIYRSPSHPTTIFYVPRGPKPAKPSKWISEKREVGGVCYMSIAAECLPRYATLCQ